MRKRALAAAVLVAGSITVAVPALGAAAERWTVTAPGMSARAGGPVAEVALDQAGKLSLGVRRGATTVLEPSALGLEAAHADFTTGLELTGLTQRVVSERYTTVTGRRTQHSLDASELTLKLTSASQQPFELVVRVAADGVAYRYVVPSPKWVTVVREASEFRVPGDADSFLLPYDNGRGDYESAHVHAKLSAQAPADYGYPSLFHVGDSWLAIMESDVDGRYGGSRLTLDGGSLRLTLPDPAETSTGPLATPWRTMVVGDLATVTESDLVTDLASPSKIADTSWIKPGAAAWSWWAEGTGDCRSRRTTWTTRAGRGGSTTWSTPAGTRAGSPSWWPTRTRGT